MFGHLDDPVGVSPGAQERANVGRRAYVLRARRRLTAATAGLLVAAGLAAFLVGGPTATHIASTETGYQFNALKGPLAMGTPVPTTALVNVVFVDDREGFALAAHRGQAVLARTTDGGSTWQVRNDNLPDGYGQSDGFSGEFEFEGSDGYLWGGAPGANGAVPLWVTSDGGVSWHAAPIGPVVYDVSAIGANVWAVAGTCNLKPSNESLAAPCALTMEQSLDAGASWHAASTGFAEVMSAPPLAQRVELARITRSRSYVLTANAPDQSGAIALTYTGDGGATWQSRPVPCAGAFTLGAEIAASGTNDLWLLCGSQASNGEQSKELYRSSDGGMAWTLTASATGLGTPPPPGSQPNGLSLGGYIAPYSIGHKNLAVASPTTAWLYPFPTVMYKTVSGGGSWTEVQGLATAGFGSGGPGNVTFISGTQGWICQYGVGLWHTSDGEHWYPLGV
jgi:hypothetical protein